MVGESAQLYRQGWCPACSVSARRALSAIHEFLQMRWPEYQENLEHVLPGRSSRRWPTQRRGSRRIYRPYSTPISARRRRGEITQPVLVVLGERSALLHPRFPETYRLLLDWLPNAKGFVLPGATHFLQLENPREMADALADFYARHPL